jgi:hypothetical protein
MLPRGAKRCNVNGYRAAFSLARTPWLPLYLPTRVSQSDEEIRVVLAHSQSVALERMRGREDKVFQMKKSWAVMM